MVRKREWLTVALSLEGLEAVSSQDSESKAVAEPWVEEKLGVLLLLVRSEMVSVDPITSKLFRLLVVRVRVPVA